MQLDINITPVFMSSFIFVLSAGNWSHSKCVCASVCVCRGGHAELWWLIWEPQTISFTISWWSCRRMVCTPSVGKEMPVPVTKKVLMLYQKGFILSGMCLTFISWSNGCEKALPFTAFVASVGQLMDATSGSRGHRVHRRKGGCFTDIQAGCQNEEICFIFLI